MFGSGWRRKVGNAHVDFQDGIRTLFDVRFADDILLFFRKCLLDELVICSAQVGLQLNVRKAKILTTQSQNRSKLPLRNGQEIEVLDRASTHKWLGCMLCTANTSNHTLCLTHHLLHAVSKAFYAKNWYFIAVVTPVTCFGAARRNVYQKDLCFAVCFFSWLDRLVIWTGRCRGREFFTIRTNEWNFS